MRILITGAGGQLGLDLIRLLSSGHELHAMTRGELDVSDGEAVWAAVGRIRPDVIIHAAAHTLVDEAESDPDQAYQVNAFGTRNLAAAARHAGAKLVYVSTDYVFDGRKGSPYTEFDATSPLNVYGASKLAGEECVKMLHDRFYIVRTAWLYGANGNNFIKKVCALARTHKEIPVVSDQVGTPTYTLDLARFISRLIETNHYGVYHGVNQGYCSRYELAKVIIETLQANGVKLIPVSSSQYKLPAKRPENSALDDLAIRMSGLPRLRPWDEAVRAFLLQELKMMNLKKGER